MGSKGRMGIFEVLYKTPALESLILTKPSEQDIMKESAQARNDYHQGRRPDKNAQRICKF